MNDYDLSTKLYTSPIEPGRSLRLSENNTYLQLKESVRDDCLTDPQLCFKTGLTIGLWLKRKGNNSLSSRQSNVCNAWRDTVAAIEAFRKYLTNSFAAQVRSSSDQFLQILKKFLKIFATSC